MRRCPNALSVQITCEFAEACFSELIQYGCLIGELFEAKLAQDDLKMAQVGVKLAQLSAKLDKIQHNLEKIGARCPLRPPSWSHLGAQVGPSGAYVGSCGRKKRVKTPSEKMLPADIHFLSIFERNLTPW